MTHGNYMYYHPPFLIGRFCDTQHPDSYVTRCDDETMRIYIRVRRDCPDPYIFPEPESLSRSRRDRDPDLDITEVVFGIPIPSGPEPGSGPRSTFSGPIKSLHIEV
ncbi:unnamed protein product [Adineta ricciae]|uniref:Uncharacterized protein n=1 Tax=Adineta ricciae TaxID=249248 RepID=A0A816C2M8_ADIRI|nr:unnamed protein product [Adineta ricciae]